MKKISVFPSLLMIVLFLTKIVEVGRSESELLIEEHFDYADGDSFHADARWKFSPNGPEGTLDPIRITSGSLFKQGIKGKLGNKFSVSGNFEGSGFDIPQAPNVYISGCLRIDALGKLLNASAPTMVTDGPCVLYLGWNYVGVAAGLHVRLVEGRVQFGLSKTTGGDAYNGVIWDTTKSYSAGETIFFVLNYSTVGEFSDDDIVRAWLYKQDSYDPSWGSSSPSAPTLLLGTGWPDRIVNKFDISWSWSGVPLPNLSIDMLRVGTTFASVTPRTFDSDVDGLTDEAEILLSALGFDPNVNNAEQVISLFVNPNNAFLYTQSQHNSNRTNGQTDVTTNPSAFNLFTQDQFNSNRTAGQSDVISSPMSYGLYTSNSIMDLRMGGLMIQRQGTNAVVSFQPQTTTDLTLPFTNNGTPITNEISMPGNKGFIRINAKP